MEIQKSMGGTTFPMATVRRIQTDLKEIKKYPLEGVAVDVRDDIGVWDIFLEGPKATPFEGGIYQLELSFPHTYPDSPPKLRFVSAFYHPNVYPDGRVCISILHEPGDDEMAGESFAIRWKPINSVSSILNSLLLLLMEPNFSSPANVDASVEWRNSPNTYQAKARELAQRAQEVFSQEHSDVFIPHPDSNPDERLIMTIRDDDEKKMQTVEVWEDSDEQEFGSGEEMSSID